MRGWLSPVPLKFAEAIGIHDPCVANLVIKRVVLRGIGYARLGIGRTQHSRTIHNGFGCHGGRANCGRWTFASSRTAGGEQSQTCDCA